MKNVVGLQCLLLVLFSPCTAPAGMDEPRPVPDQFAEVVLAVEGMT